jgi:UDP-N-acetyl-D-galactosamine dehydrogenase
VTAIDLQAAGLSITDDPSQLRTADIVIVAVPTPVDSHKKPDLSPLVSACRTVGRNMGPAALVVFESTVYPGVTEEVCVSVLEAESGLRCGTGFAVGYSPERINPGDQEHTLDKVVKVVAGMNTDVTDRLADLYRLVTKAGVHKAPSIRVAEAAKVIENTQRDLNIALMNELSIIFNRAGIDTRAVLEAAETKWNFLPFRPGLVGGHCIGIDPYYLTYKAEDLGYQPQVILSGRRINDSMGTYVAEQTVKLMIRAGIIVQNARVLMLGLSFKPNVGDIRNTRVAEVIAELTSYGVRVETYDPLVDAQEAARELGLRLADDPFPGTGVYDAVVVAVAHDPFRERSVGEYAALLRARPRGVVVDVQGFLTRADVEALGLVYWSL